MMNSKLTWFALGLGAAWGYHHFVKPLPAAKS
jgi:hypothetical protein